MFRFKDAVKFKEYKLLIFFSGIIISFILGFTINGYIFANQVSPRQENHQSGYKYISPLLECSNVSANDNRNNKIREKVQDLINQEIDNKNISFASIYLRDLNNGPWLGFNEKEKFSPASLMKVPLLISYLKLAETNPEILTKKVINNDTSYENLTQNIVPLKQAEYGKTYTINELLTYIIKYSDNSATNVLLDNIDPDILNQVYSDLNLSIPADNQENYMNVLDYASFFRILYNATYLDKTMSEKALSLLSTSAFVNGIVAGVPSGVEVAHKFGERVIGDTKQLHDCGIIYRKNSNYLVCIMTRGDDFQKMESSIKDFSKLIYDNF